jgi:hypothetical protein
MVTVFRSFNPFSLLVQEASCGLGLGEGRQKLFFLPEPHTDFIFAIMKRLERVAKA